MPEQPTLEQLRQMAAETILETANLTDELTDEEAQPLIAWGLAQAAAAAEDAATTEQTVTSSALAALPASDLRASLADKLTPVRRTMRVINSLAADRHDLSLTELSEELAYLLELAGRLPAPFSLSIPNSTLAELAARQSTMDNAAFVRVVLALLEGEPAPQQETGEQSLAERQEHDKTKAAEEEQQATASEKCRHPDRPAHSDPVSVADHRDPGPRPI